MTNAASVLQILGWCVAKIRVSEDLHCVPMNATGVEFSWV